MCHFACRRGGSRCAGGPAGTVQARLPARSARPAAARYPRCFRQCRCRCPSAASCQRQGHREGTCLGPRRCNASSGCNAISSCCGGGRSPTRTGPGRKLWRQRQPGVTCGAGAAAGSGHPGSVSAPLTAGSAQRRPRVAAVAQPPVRWRVAPCPNLFPGERRRHQTYPACSPQSLRKRTVVWPSGTDPAASMPALPLGTSLKLGSVRGRL